MLRPLEGTLYIAIGVSQEALDTELQKEVRERTALLQASFRALQPRVRLQGAKPLTRKGCVMNSLSATGRA